MTPDPEKKISISSEEVQAKKVDDALAQQMSFGMPNREPEEKTAWYYQSWFVLMIAGALGAFLAWAATEPFYDDTQIIKGNVGDVNPDAVLSGQPGIRGKIEVSDYAVYTLGPSTQMDTGDGVWRPVDLSQFKEGQVVEVEGQMASAEMAIMLAYRIRIFPNDTGTYVPEPAGTETAQACIMGLLLFPFIAACVGLLVGAADGIVSRAYGRAAFCAMVGFGIGLVGGMITNVAGSIVYGITTSFAMNMDSSTDLTRMSTGAFLVQMMGRGLAWAIVGVAMGMGQGIALKSKKLFFNGMIGGVLGGLLGGLLFDPINYAVGGGQFAHNAASSRAVGFVVIGLSVGLMIGIVELIAREAWLKMLAGPLAGKEFVLYRDPTSIGSSPKQDVYLFKDPDVEPVHARIHRAGEGYEIEDGRTPSGTYVNGRKVSRQRLNSQDQIRIGSTVLLFTMKED